jgi:hypothetical protein
MEPEHESEEKEVTAEDQAHINEFSRYIVFCARHANFSTFLSPPQSPSPPSSPRVSFPLSHQTRSQASVYSPQIKRKVPRTRRRPEGETGGVGQPPRQQ